MALHEKARDRLADVRELEPTTNGELRERWGLSSGKEVHQYFTTELADYTYRDDSNKIRTRKDVDLSGESESDSRESESGADTGTQSVVDERVHSSLNREGTTEPESAADGRDMNGTGDETPASSEGYSVGEVADIVETAVGEARNETVEQATTGVKSASKSENTDDGVSVEETATERDYEGVVCQECGKGTLIDARGHKQIELPDGRVVGAPHDYYCNNFATCGVGFIRE